MLPNDPHEALMEFRGHYGRYCAIAAEGIHEHGTMRPTEALNRARLRAVQSAKCLKVIPGVTRSDILEAARQVKHAIEAEWDVRIPLTREV